MSDAEAVDALWQDLIRILSSFGSVLLANDGLIVIYDRASHAKEKLKFSREDWFEFVNGRGRVHGRGHILADTENPSWAIDELWETLGAKGSPLVIRNGRIEHE